MGGSNILEQIKNNEIETLHLSDEPEAYFETSDAFVDAMSGNTSIKTVIFDNDFLSCSMGNDRAATVSCVGKLPNVEKVVLKDSLLMVGICVTNLVENAKHLEDLTMENCLLQGIPSDFGLLEDALKNNDSVKSLHIADCTAPNEDVKLDSVMDSLKGGLSIDVTGAGASITA